MSQEKLKTILCKMFWGQTKCIVGDVNYFNLQIKVDREKKIINSRKSI